MVAKRGCSGATPCTAYRHLKFSTPRVLICKVRTKRPFHGAAQRGSDSMHGRRLGECLAHDTCPTNVSECHINKPGEQICEQVLGTLT